MNRYLTLSCSLLLLALAILASAELSDRTKALPIPSNPKRIVSLAPNITETLFYLGFGDKIVGATQFCDFPPKAKTIPRVGGFHEVNPEAILRTKPDLVILPKDLLHYKSTLESLGLPTLSFDSTTLHGYLRDVRKIGMRLGVNKEAAALSNQFQGIVNSKSLSSEIKPRILIAILNGDECSKPITDFAIIGDDGFYNEIIQAAGGTNSYQGSAPYPRISRDALLVMNPDIIIASCPQGSDLALYNSYWKQLDNLSAIKNNLLIISDDPGITVPGPRSTHTLNLLTTAIGKSSASE